MKIKHLIIIAIVAIVAIANILVAQQVKNQRNMLTIDNVTSFVAEGEDGEGGFWFWGEKDAYCQRYITIIYPGGRIDYYPYGNPIIVNDCVRALSLDCEFVDCPDDYMRL